MRVLILGSGGREHAFAWKIGQSPHCEALFIAPGNAGTAQLGTNLPLSYNDFDAIKVAVVEHKIDFILVGPEEPLVNGIVNSFKADPNLSHIPVIGPDAEGAQLEGSKAYAKEFMAAQSIPTAGYRSFSTAELAEGLDYIEQQQPPIVLKADGLAAGKGVLICPTIAEAKEEFTAMLSGKFGTASANVVIEEFLDGIEFSMFVLSDGLHYKILPIAKDYKRIGEGDTGLNTGGMGAVSPVPFVDDSLKQKVIERVVEPTLKELTARKIDYKGFIFIGLILVKGEPFVIEYNCRMGDPETEVVLPRLESDLLALLAAMPDQRLDKEELSIDPRSAATIMLVSGGYPTAYEKGKKMEIPAPAPDSIFFHAGTKADADTILTNGGRVLAITSFGETHQAALTKSLAQAEKVQFEGKYYRSDIGFDLNS